MKAIIFARISSHSQEDGQSIPSQVRRLTEYALKRNFKIEHTYQVVESSSKETRKQFEEIINFIKKAREPYALITDTVDRLQRSFRETPQLDELRKQGKIELHFLREGLIVNKNSNSAQLLQWDVGVLFASSYVRQQSDNIKRSQEQCLRNGQFPGKGCFGYTNISLPSGQKSIVINPDQAPWVVKIFEEYAKGNNSYQTIADKMKAEGFPRSIRGALITDRTVELILRNPFYYGMMKIKNQLYPHKYEKIITEELFHRVQGVIANHHKAPIQYAGKPILLRGLITCKNCGSAVSGDIKKEKYVYYACHNARRLCIKKWVKEEVLLKVMLDQLDQIKLTDDQIDQVARHIEEYEVKEQEVIQQAQRLRNDQLNITQERISKLIDMHIDGKIDGATYHFKLEEYKQAQQKLLLEIKSYNTCSKVEQFAAKEVLQLINNSKEIFMSSKLSEKQQLLGFFFSNLQLNSETLDLELREPFNLMAKSHDQHVWSGRRDSNSQPLAPKASALPIAPRPDIEI